MKQLSKHGITILEQATSFSPPVIASAALPVFIGIAPVHRTASPADAVQKPIMVSSYAEAVAALGYSDDWEKWTLCEAMNAQFRQFGVAPAVFINVFDPSKAPQAVAGASMAVLNGRVEIDNELIIPASLVIMNEAGGTEAAKDIDYTVTIMEGGVTITPMSGGALKDSTALYVAYSVATPDAVTSKDIIGGADAAGQRTGIELVDSVFPKLRLVAGLLAAPGWDEDIEVSQTLIAKARSINGLFKSMAVVDIPESAGTSYRVVPSWKETSGLTSEFAIACWPRVTLGDRTYHLSTQLCGLMGRTDYANGDVPFHSPSNQALQMDGTVWLGKEVNLDMTQANYLNDNGIVTAINWIGGWRAWGNRPCLYPATTDPKDAWIPVRRMFNWISNSIVQSYWQRIDLPIRRVLIDDICTSINVWFNGLVSAGALLGGRIEFRDEDNPKTAIMDAKIKFHVYICPAIPAQEIEFVLEYDPDYLSVLTA